MITIIFNPWDEILSIVNSRWPDIKAEVFFTDTKWDWSEFPDATLWYHEGRDTAIIRINYNLPLMDTVEILTKSLAYIAFYLETKEIPDSVSDKSADEYHQWIFQEYNRRVAEKNRQFAAAFEPSDDTAIALLGKP